MTSLKNSVVLSIICSLALVLGAGELAADEAKAVVHLSQSTNDLHAVSMALKLGTLLQNSGTQVTLFVDLEGVRIADVRQPLDLAWGTGKPVKDLYKAFVDAGGKVLVCPHCAAAAGLDAESLRQGAEIGTEETVAKTLTEASKILDY